MYHLTSRGNAKQDIFLDDTDRKIFLRLLGSTVSHFRWRLYAYCLMGNHYHLLSETPEPNLSRGSIVVERETYLLELVRYIALRNAAIVDAYKNHGYTFADIARHLRLHYSTVSRIAQGGVPQFKT